MDSIENANVRVVSESADELAKRHADAVDEAHRYGDKLRRDWDRRMIGELYFLFAAVIVLLLVNLFAVCGFLSNASQRKTVSTLNGQYSTVIRSMAAS